MLDSLQDAKNWIEKSIVSLQEGQRLFKDDISNLKAEILEVELEEDQHNRKLNDSIVYAGLHFFFGNASLAEKKRKLPEYHALVNRYSKAQSEVINICLKCKNYISKLRLSYSIMKNLKMKQRIR